MKKPLKIAGLCLLGLILIAVLLPLIFKKQIITLVKKELNASLTAVVDFHDVNISFFRRFPRVSIRLENVSVVGTNEFAKDTLLSASSLDASVDLISFFKEEKKVHRLDLQSPRIHALVTKEGKANWDIARPDSNAKNDTNASDASFRLKLSKYSISNGYIYYNDEPSGMKAEISGLNHEGSGDLTDDIFTLSTNTESASAYFAYEGIPYLNGVKASIQSDIVIDNRTSTYKFNHTKLSVNNLDVETDGFFQMASDSSYNMDIQFNAPSTDFKDLLSLIPAVYRNGFDELKAGGTAAFNGFVKGTYSPVAMPAYELNATVDKGFFQYPNLPKPVKNIQLRLKAANPDGIADHAYVDLSKGHIEFGNEPFDFRFIFKNPETSRYLDAVAKGKLDLSQLATFIHLDEGTRLGGLVGIDAFAKGNLSAVEAGQGPFSAGGYLDIRNLLYASKDFPQPIQHGNMKLEIRNTAGVADQTTVDIKDAHLEVGNDPVDFTLQLKRPMSAVDFNGTAKGKFTLDHLKQFMTLEPGTSVSGLLTADLSFSGSKAAIDKDAYEQINTKGTASMRNLNYVSKDYPTGIQVAATDLSFTPNSMTLHTLRGSFQQSNFTASGFFNNLMGYALKNESLQGKLNLDVDQVNLNELMGTSTDTSTSSTASAPFQVPAKMDLELNTKAGKVKYDKVDYTNISGRLLLRDETVLLQDVQTTALDGTMTMNGSYSTRVHKAEPDISLNYAVKDLDIQKTFFAFNTVQKLMPVGQFLSGRLSSQLNLKGNLNGDLMPNLSTLSGNGNLLLLEGVLKKFAPLEKIASTLNISELKDVALKDVKSYIEFSNGKVLIKPFTVKVRDIEMLVGGTHGFDQTMDYIVQMKLPRKYLGAQGNNLVNNLVTQANNKGAAIKMGETVNLNVRLSGLISNPSMQTELKEVAGDAAKALKEQAVDFARQKLDSTKQSIRDTATALKKQVINEAKEEVKKQIFGNTDSVKTNLLDNTKQKAGDAVKNTFGKFMKKKKAVKDSL